MSIPQRTGFAQLPRMEGWDAVIPPVPVAPPQAAIVVKVAMTRGNMRLSISLSPAICQQLGNPEFVTVSQNKAEKALMLVKAEADSGFKLSAFGGNLSKDGSPKRKICYLEPWRDMTIETVGMQANGEVVEHKGVPVLVIRLPYGLFPKTGLGARS